MKLIDESIKILKILDIPIKIGVLAGVRPGSLGKIPFLDETYKDAEEIVAHFKNGYDIKNYNIEFEKALADQCSIITEVNGMVGNQVLRSLVFAGGLKIYGVPVCGIRETVIDTFRNSDDFTLYILFCAALISLKQQSYGKI
jgi:predicted methyltransferase MtxX (methanogen marker protein 4)